VMTDSPSSLVQQRKAFEVSALCEFSPHAQATHRESIGRWKGATWGKLVRECCSLAFVCFDFIMALSELRHVVRVLDPVDPHELEHYNFIH